MVAVVEKKTFILVSNCESDAKGDHLPAGSCLIPWDLPLRSVCSGKEPATRILYFELRIALCGERQ